MFEMLSQGGWVLGVLFLLSLALFYLISSLYSFQYENLNGLETQKAAVSEAKELLRWMKVIVTVAPLLGLLGTVNGMVKLFEGLGRDSSSLNQIGVMSEGISQALLTTQCGLLITVPGLLFIFAIKLKFKNRGLI